MTPSQSLSLLTVGLGLGAAVFVGYCVYKKRGSDPSLKQKLEGEKEDQFEEVMKDEVRKQMELIKLRKRKQAEDIKSVQNKLKCIEIYRATNLSVDLTVLEDLHLGEKEDQFEEVMKDEVRKQMDLIELRKRKQAEEIKSVQNKLKCIEIYRATNLPVDLAVSRELHLENQKVELVSKSVQKSKGKGPAILDLSSPEDAQAFFLQEVQLGEELLAEGEIEEGVDHLCTAVTLCGQPQGFLQILQQNLPPTVFALLIERLPGTQARLMEQTGGGRGGSGWWSRNKWVVVEEEGSGMSGAPKQQGAQIDGDDDTEDKDDPPGHCHRVLENGLKEQCKTI